MSKQPVKIRLYENNGHTILSYGKCQKDICDCDPEAKDECEDCECGLAWYGIEPETMAFSLPSELYEIIVADERK